MNWISVKDRLPEKEMKLLVLIGNEVFFGESYYPGSIFIITTEKYIYFQMQKKLYCKWLETDIVTGINKWLTPSYFKEPTHWMPLPEPPKEK